MKRGDKIPVYPGEWIWTKIGKDRVEIKVDWLSLSQDEEIKDKHCPPSQSTAAIMPDMTDYSRIPGKCDKEGYCDKCKYAEGYICKLPVAIYEKVKEAYNAIGITDDIFIEDEQIPLAQIGHGKMFKLVRPKRKKNE